MFEFDWDGAEKSFRVAISSGPENSELFDLYGLFLSAIGRYDEALAAQRKAHDLDPLASVVMSDIASVLVRAGRYDEAIGQAGRLLQVEPHFPMAHSTIGWALIIYFASQKTHIVYIFLSI